MITSSQLSVAREFANGRCYAIKGLYHPDFKTALENGEKWKPKIGQTFVHIPSAPYGHDTKQKALEAARKTKASSQIWLEENT